MNDVVTTPDADNDSLTCMRVYAPDRRVTSWRTVLYSLFLLRRAGQRREQNPLRGHHYVDIHESKLFFMAVATLLLCVADAFFTMTLLNFYGSSEINPLMDLLIQADFKKFFFVKFGLTASGILFLVMHKNFRILNRISGYHILLSCVILYVVLAFYEVTLMLINTVS